MKNVCFLVTSLESGGAENYLLRFLQFSQKDCRALVLCKSGKKGILEEQYIKAGAQVVTISSGYFNPKAWYQTYKLYKKNNIEAVCDFTGNFAGIYLAIAKFSGIQKRIAFYRRSSHAFKLTKFNLLYDAFVNKLVNKYATNILANSHYGLHFFHPNQQSQDNRFGVIPNGISTIDFVSDATKSEVRKSLSIPENAFVVGHTGRLNVAKNHSTMLKIAERITEKHDTIYFLFCGKDTEKLIDLTSSEKLKTRLILLGYRTDVNQVLKAMDLYLFPSITEGQPNALIEAMISGLPFLASDIEPIKEVVPERFHRLLFAPLDVDGFVNEIENSYNNPTVLETMRCKEYASEQFDAQKNFNKLLELL